MTPKTKLTVIYGAISALLAFLAYVAALPPETQTGIFNDLAACFPNQWHAQIGSVCKLLSEGAGLYAMWHAATKVAPTAIKLVIFTPIIAFAGCSASATAKFQATAGAVGKSSLTAVEDLAAGAAARGASNAAQIVLQDGAHTSVADLEAAGSQGLFTQVFSVQTAQDVRNIFNSFTANKAPQVATQLASAYTAANPQTDADKVAVVNALASGVMTGATK